MKAITLVLFFIINVIVLESKVLPEYLSKPCTKLTKHYQDCWLKVLREWGPHLLKGIKEINFPKLSPLHIPLFMVNRSLNDYVTVNAVLKDFKASGYDTTSLKSFQLDPHNYIGSLHLHISQLLASMEYDVSGNIFTLNIENAGYFKGIATDIELLFDFKLKPVDKLGIKYFEFDYFYGNSTIGNGVIKLMSKNNEFQPVADLITNVFNENPKRLIDAVQPIYAESVGYFYGGLAEEVLRRVPANEIVPE
ncbi:hypothetical protein RN001_012393 [Aquatica leii]|uniref:Juvenile hormone binding protein n=1 Tax=Aquatica leii TaxID=1421715 RepID=A0AAN7S7R6_9COLE|nr:hypothetical protein RN001_012393 [Aquatica leii]